MHQFTRLLIASLSFFAAGAVAEETDVPDIAYGLWETTTVTSIQSDVMSMPESSQTTSACVTEEDVQKGRAFLDDQEDCDILEQTVTDRSMDLSMVCNQPGAGEMRMNVSMQYDGDTMTGQMDGEMESPMGTMSLLISMNGKRIGDC